MSKEAELITQKEKLISLEMQVYSLLKDKKLTLTTAESATGGMIASKLINVPGISEFFTEGYVTYSNAAKVKMIGVDATVIEKYGVVSCEVAENMACSAARTANADMALSVTGVAGPDGGTEACPVGTVCIGCYYKGRTFVERHIFNGDRQSVRTQATDCALKLLIECILDD